ncbi:type 4a pilus biogenesis protein PilO [Campylobacter sp. RM16190]|uniref:type 4a pilus biogenesis protein PilO n=1 Tax=Campylobacter sp. RM16190 TaxID=1705727 RepID=UPI001475C200|nr:type 4a pilus biogenesis protein PilO [Campylobacter sp. RM16190]
MKKDNILVKIDTYFDSKKDSEVSMMLLGTLVIVAFLTYLITWDPAQQYYETTLSQNEEISRKLNDTNNYLASVTVNGDMNFKIKEQQNRLNSLNKELDTAKFTNQYFDNKLQELSYLLFNEQNWAKFLDSLAFLANKNSVKITKISNEFKNPTPKKIEQVLDIKIDLEGSFKDIVGYINSIEESDLVVDVNHMDINSTKKDLIGTVGIYVWGMKY